MQQTNWTNNPTKKQLALTVIAGLTGFILLLLSMTNFFKETPFQGKYFILHFLLIGSSLTVYKVCRAYYRNNK